MIILLNPYSLTQNVVHIIVIKKTKKKSNDLFKIPFSNEMKSVQIGHCPLLFEKMTFLSKIYH